MDEKFDASDWMRANNNNNNEKLNYIDTLFLDWSDLTRLKKGKS